MWCGDCVTAIFCNSLIRSGSVKKRNEPTSPLRVSSSAFSREVYWPAACSSCPIFSAEDICARRSSANWTACASDTEDCCAQRVLAARKANEKRMDRRRNGILLAVTDLFLPVLNKRAEKEWLEQKLQDKLNLTRIVSPSRRSKFAEAAIAQAGIRIAERRRVSQVENLGTELQLVVLMHWKSLEG